MVITLVSIYFRSPWLGYTTKTNCIKRHAVDLEICSILILLNEFGTVFSTTFFYGFSWNKFFMLHSINRPNFILWLPLLLEILGNMFIVIISFLVHDAMNLVMNLSSLIKLFSHMTKNVRTKSKYFKNTKGF